MKRALMLLFLVAACGDSTATTADMAAPDLDAPDDLAYLPLVAARPYHFHVPLGYDKSKPTPLVILLHGYTATGDEQEAYFKLTAVSDAHTFLYAYPDGTVDKSGQHFWNATDACCDMFGTGVDDVAYLNAVIDDMERKFNVDAKRVYFVGHSNGAFMSHRMACDDASRVAAIVALAGDVWKDDTKCMPSEAVPVLQVHGDADTVIQYGGGATPEGAYPSAHQSVATWAAKDKCTGTLQFTGTTLDLETVLPGQETKVEAYTGCPTGIDVQLWTIQGGSHIPAFTSSWGEDIYGFLAQHAKP